MGKAPQKVFFFLGWIFGVKRDQMKMGLGGIGKSANKKYLTFFYYYFE